MARLGEAGQHKASLRKSLQSALAHKRLANEILDSLVDTQEKLNATLDKLDADAPAAVPAVAATATLNLTADITLTSVATGAARNTTTFTLEVEAAAANPTDTILADFTGTAGAIVLTITPNDGTNNGATPVDLTTAELAELISTGAVVGKTVTVTDASSLRALQTAAGGDATALADAGEGDGVVGTFSGGANAIGALDTNYEASGEITDLFEADGEGSGAQHKASLRQSLRAALAHKKLADELADALEEMQVAYNALLVKLDAEAGTLDDGDYEATLALEVMDPEAAMSGAQHKASMRVSLISALAHRRLADELLDAMVALQEAFNAALVKLDAATINGQMAALKVSVLDPDA